MALNRQDEERKFEDPVGTWKKSLFLYSSDYRGNKDLWEIIVSTEDLPDSPTDVEIREEADNKAKTRYSDWKSFSDARTDKETRSTGHKALVDAT